MRIGDIWLVLQICHKLAIDYIALRRLFRRSPIVIVDIFGFINIFLGLFINEQMYVIVDYPDSTVPEEQKLIPNKPATYVPIPLVTRRCEKKCCSMTAIPIQVCKALSIHKSQGMTVGEGKQ